MLIPENLNCVLRNKNTVPAVGTIYEITRFWAVEGICCRGLFRYLHKLQLIASPPSLLPVGVIVDSALNLSVYWVGWGAVLILPSAQGAHSGVFDAMVTLVVLVLLMVNFNYFSSFLAGCRALLSTDLTESTAVLCCLSGHHRCITIPKRNKQTDWKLWDQFSFFQFFQI